MEVFHQLVHQNYMWDICLDTYGNFLMASTSSLRTIPKRFHLSNAHYFVPIIYKIHMYKTTKYFA
jgi:hypothetical protein